jgi:hypothetical protein
MVVECTRKTHPVDLPQDIGALEGLMAQEPVRSPAKDTQGFSFSE